MWDENKKNKEQEKEEPVFKTCLALVGIGFLALIVLALIGGVMKVIEKIIFTIFPTAWWILGGIVIFIMIKNSKK